jgi:hypothetical protein
VVVSSTFVFLVAIGGWGGKEKGKDGEEEGEERRRGEGGRRGNSISDCLQENEVIEQRRKKSLSFSTFLVNSNLRFGWGVLSPTFRSFAAYFKQAGRKSAQNKEAVTCQQKKKKKKKKW